VRKACRAMVRRRAATSGGMTLVPLPGSTWPATWRMLMELIPAINRKFGLTPEQIDSSTRIARVMVYAMLKKVARRFGRGAKKVITKKLGPPPCWRR
jgi:uncharacterized protein (DUF697 family)